MSDFLCANHGRMQVGTERNLAPPFKPSRMLQSGELRCMFESTEQYTVLHDEDYVLQTRGVEVPATFFVARKYDIEG